jgi:hypothetical protein
MSYIPAQSAASAKSPKRWAPGYASDKHLLPVPASPALHALLDLVRQLLAWTPAHGFVNGDAKLVVAAIDEVRLLLHNGAAAAACYSISALALKQITQRDLYPAGDSSKRASRPNVADVFAARQKCYNRAVAQTGSLAPSAPLQVAVAGTFELLPFAITSGGKWLAHKFTLECDAIDVHSRNGMGVWVTWSRGSAIKGMGYVEEVHDKPPVGSGKNMQTYTCARRYVLPVKTTSCKALKLRHATPRSKKKPDLGFLKVYSKDSTSTLILEAQKMKDACDRVKKSDDTLRLFREDLANEAPRRASVNTARGGEAGGGGLRGEGEHPPDSGPPNGGPAV